MNERVFDAFFTTEMVEAGNRNHKHTPKRDSTRSASKGNWSYRAVVCKVCNETMSPSNGISEEEMYEWPGLNQHIEDYHESEAIMIILKGLGT